ncbi:3503_t:CDS:2, partial [Scutellospora calospora]
MADSVNTYYELAYYYACIYLGRKDFKKVDQRKKYNICRKYLTDDDYSEEEIEKELGTINTQLAYLYQLQGRITEVIDLYQSDTELFDSARKLKVASANT